MSGGSSRVPLRAALVLVIGLAVVILVRRYTATPASPPPPEVAAAPPEVAAPPPATPRVDPAPEPSAVPPAGPDDAPDEAGQPDWDPGSWEAVDMDAVRKALPDNLYWTMSAPTSDPEVLRWREEERERWNVEYGKVLSNTATDEEIDAYYANRQRLSSDYVAFAGYVLLRWGDKLPKRDAGLLKLAMDMHLARLEEYPRQIVEAHERHRAHDAARRAWLEDQKAFEGDPATTP